MAAQKAANILLTEDHAGTASGKRARAPPSCPQRIFFSHNDL